MDLFRFNIGYLFYIFFHLHADICCAAVYYQTRKEAQALHFILITVSVNGACGILHVALTHFVENAQIYIS